MANSFFVQTVPRELNAESKSARLQDKTVSHRALREGFGRPEELNPCRLLQFRARGIANSADSALFRVS